MFSAVIPVYNHAAYVIEAVQSALSSPLVTEVLVVDDGSSDGSAAVLEGLAAGDSRVKNFTEKPPLNRGAHNRLNQLIWSARNEWVAVLNSDDRFVPGRFEVCQQLIRLHGPELICGHLLIMDQTGAITGTKRGVLEPEFPYPADLDVAGRAEAGDVLTLLASQNFVATTSNMVFTKALHERVGGFSDLRYAHDYEFILRAVFMGRVTYTPHFLTTYRVHATNTIRESGSRRGVVLELQDIFRRILADFPHLRDDAGFMRVMRARPAEQEFDLVK